MGIADTIKRAAAVPKELASDRNRPLPKPQREQTPDPGFQPWSQPDEGQVSEAAARREGMAALARSELYRQPTVDELAEQQVRDNAIAAAHARKFG